ncbi:MAG: hypothetical protein M3R51_10260, partial [Candidatus Eremiobacteraeota bacterium]|nr:hypothetical protein [Candidatus Eremiobacteraeota bacterium]
SLERRDPQSIDRARSWGTNLRRKYAWFLFVLDVDDGYAGGFWKTVRPSVTAGANALTWVIKRIQPSNAVERSKQL